MTSMQCSVCNLQNVDSAPVCRACGAVLVASVAAPTSHILAPGTRLKGGAFSVGKVLGRGGFGITYLGADAALGRAIAIKEFFPEGCVRESATVHPGGVMTTGDYQQARERFLDEARTLARFQHPGIVQVFASFEENNTAYMTMELVKGRTLLSLIVERGSLPEDEAVGYVVQAGKALAVVHLANLLHRDVKPDNLMVAEGGRVVLLDFGTAREFASGKTKRMTAKLTRGYAPLEQYGQQAKFGPYTEVYALAATLYHALTGEMPVEAPDRTQGVELPPPNRLVRSITRNVSDAIMWAMEMKATSRPQSVSDFIKALQSGLVEPEVVHEDTPGDPTSWRNPHDARIKQILQELRQPNGPMPPSSFDAALEDVKQRLAAYAAFAPEDNRCPACNSAALSRVNGDPTGLCPLCRTGKLMRRRLDDDKCPVCRQGRLAREKLPEPIVFCPVCRSMPLGSERRKRFGLSLDLWWTCQGCKAEFDVLMGGRAKLVGFAADPFGFGEKHLGQTFDVEEWHRCSPRVDVRCACSRCAAVFYDIDQTRMALVQYNTDPHGVGKRYVGKTYFRLMWSKLAHALPQASGNVFCAECRAEFDLDSTAGTLNLLSCDAEQFAWAVPSRGQGLTVQAWYLASAGKQSGAPGWLCGACNTEFDDTANGVKLVRTTSRPLSALVGQCFSLWDWHRFAARVPTQQQNEELLANLECLNTRKKEELSQYTQQQRQQTSRLESQLAGLFKESLLLGAVSHFDKDNHALSATLYRSGAIGIRGGELVRWNSPAQKLRQRSRQGIPYWDTDGDGTLFVTSDRILFASTTGTLWERPLAKLYQVFPDYVNRVPIVVTSFHGLQKPIAFVVPDQQVQVTLSAHTCNVTLQAADLIAVLNNPR